MSAIRDEKAAKLSWFSQPQVLGMLSSLMEIAKVFASSRLHVMVLLLIPLLPDVLSAQETGAPAVVRAEQEATLSSLVSGVIKTYRFDEGDQFEAGDVLVDLDCRLYQYEADATKARRASMLAELSAREKLFQRGGIGKLEVDALRAETDAIVARVNAAALRVEYCQLRAPFAGRVTEHNANAFEYLEPGQPVLSIVSSGTPDLEIIVPAEWLTWIDIGTVGRLRLDARTEEYPVTVGSIAPAIDPVSRTLRITASIDADTSSILPGMSGYVTLEQSQ